MLSDMFSRGFGSQFNTANWAQMPTTYPGAKVPTTGPMPHYPGPGAPVPPPATYPGPKVPTTGPMPHYPGPGVPATPAPVGGGSGGRQYGGILGAILSGVPRYAHRSIFGG